MSSNFGDFHHPVADDDVVNTWWHAHLSHVTSCISCIMYRARGQQHRYSTSILILEVLTLKHVQLSACRRRKTTPPYVIYCLFARCERWTAMQSLLQSRRGTGANNARMTSRMKIYAAQSTPSTAQMRWNKSCCWHVSHIVSNFGIFLQQYKCWWYLVIPFHMIFLPSQYLGIMS